MLTSRTSIKLIAAVIGAGIGYGVATLIVDQLEKNERQMSFQGIEDLGIEITPEMAEDGVTPEYLKVKKEVIKSMEKSTNKRPNFNYATRAFDDMAAKAAIDDVNKTIEQEQYAPAEEIDTTQPHIISDEAYNLDTKHPKQPCIYFAGDEVLVKSDGRTVISTMPWKLLGDDISLYPGEDRDTVNIFNPIAGVIYRVEMRLSESYSEEVGELPQQPARRRRPQSGKVKGDTLTEADEE